MISRERPDCQTQTPAESGQAEKWLPDSSGGASKTRRQQGMGGHTKYCGPKELTAYHANPSPYAEGGLLATGSRADNLD